MKNLAQIHWHDTQIKSVIELPAQDELIYHVNYPDDWEQNIFTLRKITFSGHYSHSVDEGPFHGSPTILNASVVQEHDQFTTIRLQTNAGSRSITAESVAIE